MKPLGKARRIAVVCKLPFISEAAAYVKVLTGGRMVAVAHNLQVFF